MDVADCKTYLWQKRGSTLRSDLDEAYHSRDFVGILLNDAMIPQVVERAIEQGITLNPTSGSQQDESLQSGFVNCYIDNTAKLLVESLNKEYAAYPTNTALHGLYSSAISVVQPSGMGKSRMFEEARKSVFTIPTHVCEEAGDGKIGHPLPDEEIDFQQLFDEDDARRQADYEVLLRDIYVRARESVMVQQSI
ncbi:hypothetical protein RSOLAG22IIIB_09630 [Rhizoctonia solani]|uniref:Uncharacterized protein n=1 Tax=Rhizoctonia solani TaxID=456999 RepID=A0A0K6FZ02_9AGAM|nr:unnamed protein product [Rhizoctonia solani]CUA71501.1 hypothetical protein RSOLAG22IIIB_09630 [Rhizoctonia solani]